MKKFAALSLLFSDLKEAGSRFVSNLRSKPATAQEGEQEFTFYWSNKTVIKNTANHELNYFSSPSRTKISATSIEAAKAKLARFAKSKVEFLSIPNRSGKAVRANCRNL